MTEKFKVQFLEEAVEFLDNLDEKTRDKIIYNITKAQRTNDNELFKKMTGEIWEFRTLFKKTGKTPQSDLEKAERIRSTYFQKNRQK